MRYYHHFCFSMISVNHSIFSSELNSTSTITFVAYHPFVFNVEKSYSLNMTTFIVDAPSIVQILLVCCCQTSNYDNLYSRSLIAG
jgi:hypothetical protein